MRPAGDVSKALLEAVQRLATDERGLTAQEIAAAAKVGLKVAQQTLLNMRRYGRLDVPRTRRVPHCKKPVAEYALPCRKAVAPLDGFTQLQRCWG
ncbi:hypothetical protein [Comamonas terrigena]|uniref:hypothetical protein n=1 Tax=Comamonas terrigena TaxID=32013 RepID=UPI0028B03864|nr:hypothetical protein [Comamonas terrigena]